MKARVVDGTARFAERAARRRANAERRAAAPVLRIRAARAPAMDDPEWWVRDLERRPRLQRERIAPYLAAKLSPLETENQAQCGIGDLIDRRLGLNGYGLAWFARRLAAEQGEIAAAAERVRAARARGARAWFIEKERTALRRRKASLLQLLFEAGYARVPRAELAEVAACELAEERERLPAAIARWASEADAAHADLECGIYARGPRRVRCTVEDLRTLRAHAASCEARARELRDRLAYLESDPPPLRALSLYRERRPGSAARVEDGRAGSGVDSRRAQRPPGR